MANIAESTTHTIAVRAGARYVFSIAGTWDSMTATLQWSDGTNNVAFPSGALTANGALEVVAPTNIIKLVTGADASNAGALVYDLAQIK
jgi:hypothetical protein